MSFRCGFCGKAQPVRIKPVMIKTRVKREFSDAVTRWDSITGLPTISCSYREEIAEEKKACPDCAKIPREPEVMVIQKGGEEEKKSFRQKKRSKPRF